MLVLVTVDVAVCTLVQGRVAPGAVEVDIETTVDVCVTVAVEPGALLVMVRVWVTVAVEPGALLVKVNVWVTVAVEPGALLVTVDV